MELRRLVLKRTLIILSIITVFFAIIVFVWYKGMFLPSWVNWETVELSDETSGDLIVVDNKTVNVINNNEILWSLNKNCKVQSALLCDIDNDKQDELLVLCWKIGKYGKRRPFWVKHDELKWSQHIYIYEIGETKVTPKWMASDIMQEVKSWESVNDHFIVNYSPEGKKSTWTWISWGLERVPDDAVNMHTPSYSDEVTNTSDTTEEPQADIIQDDHTNKQDELPDGDITIVMVGDILLHDGVVASCVTDEGGYDFTPLVANTRDEIANADIAIANQEVILGGEELRITGYPSFNGPFQVADALVNTGFDVVCHGTNHALDRGKKGIVSCLDYWRNHYPDVSVLGIYDNEDDYNSICIKEVNGIKIAVLNYTYGTNGIPLPDGMPYAVKLLNQELISRELKYAEDNADFTIVCPHWGIEYNLTQSGDQEKMAKYMTDNGADLIIGTHPHVIEPVEWVEGDNNTKALCYYSIGNYINWTSGRGANIANRMIGGMAKVTLSDNCGNIEIKDYTVKPLVSHVEHKRGSVTTYYLDEYTEDLAGQNAIVEQDSSFSYDYCRNLCLTVWNDVDDIVEKYNEK